MSTEKSIRRKAAAPLVTLENMPGKLPPQALDLEEAVLGALMLDKNAVAEVIDLLKPEAFYRESHSRIFEAIQQLFHATQPVDILTVTQQLRKNGQLEVAGGAHYITQLTNRVASAANIEFHARIVLQKFIQRELIRISGETIRDAYEDTTDVLDLLDRAEKNLFGIAESNIRRKYESMSGLIARAVKEIEIAAQKEDGVTGVPSGFTELDRITSGWQKSDLVIVAARPGMGKTAFVLSLARNAAVQFKRPVAFFSLEMASLQLVNRLVSNETEINSEFLKKGNLSPQQWQQLNLKVAPLTNAPIYIDDTPALSVFELRAKCRRLVAEKKIELIIIDYLQLMVGGVENNKNGNREQEISHISRSLKGIAKELNIPIIALSQLSRNVERSQTKKPQLSDLRESGAIEQDADMVMFIYRPGYYGMELTEEGVSTENMAEIIVAKNRNGALKTVNLKFLSQFTKFTDFETYDFVDETSGDYPSASMTPNMSADPGRIIKNSRMNDMSDHNEDRDSAPF